MADIAINVAVGQSSTNAPEGIIRKTFRDLGDGTYAEVVAIGADGSPIEITGDVFVDTLGALDDTKVSDPDAASATIPGLLRGILDELKTQTEILQTIATNTVPL